MRHGAGSQHTGGAAPIAGARYANITLASGWTATLEALNADHGWDTTAIPPLNTLQIGALGGTAKIEFTGASRWSDPMEHENPEPPIPGEEWQGFFYEANITVQAPGTPGDSDTETVWLWVGDSYNVPPNPPEAVPGAVKGPDLSRAVTIDVSGMYLKGVREDNGNAAADDRLCMDFTDFNAWLRWYADEDSEVTVTCGSLSASGALAEAGGEVEMGNVWGCTAAFDVADYYSDDTVYARIADLQFNGRAVDLTNLNLFNPGSGDAPDSSNNPDWKRAAPASGGCARITDDGGIATWWTGDGNGTASWSGYAGVPIWGKIIPKEGAHEDSTPYSG